MIKRIKYGCFALLFISTLTLSSIVAILASSNANLDNSFYLTYEPPRPDAEYVNTDGTAPPLSETLGYSSSEKYSITFDYYREEYSEIIANVDGFSVAQDGSDEILCYIVSNGEDIYDAYVLSNSTIVLPQDITKFFSAITYTNITLKNFDTKNVTNMYSLFYDCSGLTSLDLSSLNTSNVTNMGQMFAFSTFTSLDLSSLDTSNVTSMRYMFYFCENLTMLDFSGGIPQM